MFVVIGAVKIKAIVSSFDDARRIKRLLRKTDDRSSKIVPSAAKLYFLPLLKALIRSFSARLGRDDEVRQRSPD